MKYPEQEYLDYVHEFLKNDQVKLMRRYVQHGSTSTYSHCLNVSYNSYKIAKRLRWNAKECAIGGLLHDFYLYDWHDDSRKEKSDFFWPHGFTHGRVAEQNAREIFQISEMCSDIISTHMFPLTIWKFPHFKESYIIICVDKYLSIIETFCLKSKARRLLKRCLYIPYLNMLLMMLFQK